MADIPKTRKPGRSVFFQDPDGEEPRSGNGAAEAGPSVRGMDADTQSQLHLLLDALRAVKQGNFSVRLPMAQDGLLSEIAQALEISEGTVAATLTQARAALVQELTLKEVAR